MGPAAPGAVPPGLPAISGGPDLRYVSAILERAGGAEKIEGLESLTRGDLASGTDATGFIAERDGPDLVAFAKLDPAANTQHLEGTGHSCGEPVRPLPQPLALDAVAADSAVSGFRNGSSGSFGGLRPQRSRSPASISRNCFRWGFVECEPVTATLWRRENSRTPGSASFREPRRCDRRKDGPTRGRTTSGARRRWPKFLPWRTTGGTKPTICCASHVSCRKVSRATAHHRP